jgi:lipid-A-disaccharide synthase
MRPVPSAPDPDGGVVAILPGSRSGELRRHLPVLAAAFRVLQRRRPRLRGIFGAADERAARMIAATIEREKLAGVKIARGVSSALAEADGAWVASGTAVLETALAGVPAVALYVIPPILIWYGHRMIRHRFITLPNLVLGREVVPELLQEAATPERLADTLEELMSHPLDQYAQFGELREALGPADALERCASYAVELARG